MVTEKQIHELRTEREKYFIDNNIQDGTSSDPATQQKINNFNMKIEDMEKKLKVQKNLANFNEAYPIQEANNINKDDLKKLTEENEVLPSHNNMTVELEKKLADSNFNKGELTEAEVQPRKNEIPAKIAKRPDAEPNEVLEAIDKNEQQEQEMVINNDGNEPEELKATEKKAARVEMAKKAGKVIAIVSAVIAVVSAIVAPAIVAGVAPAFVTSMVTPAVSAVALKAAALVGLSTVSAGLAVGLAATAILAAVALTVLVGFGINKGVQHFQAKAKAKKQSTIESVKELLKVSRMERDALLQDGKSVTIAIVPEIEQLLTSGNTQDRCEVTGGYIDFVESKNEHLDLLVGLNYRLPHPAPKQEQVDNTASGIESEAPTLDL